jgi:predicted nucleic acid-binding protein
MGAAPVMARPHLEAVFDTNILMDYLMGRDAALQEFDRYTRRGISIITWMELQSGARSETESDVIDLFLREFRVIEISRQIARRAAELHRRSKVRLPDAIVWATAEAESARLVTSNKKLAKLAEPT